MNADLLGNKMESREIEFASSVEEMIKSVKCAEGRREQFVCCGLFGTQIRK